MENVKEVATIKEAVTPYEISEFLKEVHEISWSANRIYGDRKKKLIQATRGPLNGKAEVWVVTAQEANRYVKERVLARGKSTKNKKW